MKRIRVRFAPSPTGPLHLGGVRAALYNYLFARKHHGDFILRIEDTDQERLVPGAEAYILRSLRWCGIVPDEGPDCGGGYGPYRQSERSAIYAPYIQQLLRSGHAYCAFDTPEALDALRVRAQAGVFTYDSRIRDGLDNALKLSPDEVAERLALGEPYVIRFKIPTRQKLELDDVIRGRISVDTSTLDDKVLVKSDGLPTYHLANVIDDHLMQISHVIRGEEWLPSMPLHLLLYHAFGWEAPYFAHLPLILKPEGKGKLSKRDGDEFDFPVFPLRWEDPQSGAVSQGYREEGYFPEAFINMIALLGWNPGREQELFSMEELIENFSLERVNKSGAHFSKEKAQWFNQQYLQCKPLEEVSSIFHQMLRLRGVHATDDYICKVVGAVRERAHFVHEIWDQAAYFFIPPEAYEVEAMRKISHPEMPVCLEEVKDLLHEAEDFTVAVLRERLQNFVKYRQLGFGQLMQALRLALVGGLYGANVFFIMEMIGRQESLRRLSCFCQVLNDSVMD